MELPDCTVHILLEKKNCLDKNVCYSIFWPNSRVNHCRTRLSFASYTPLCVSLPYSRFRISDNWSKVRSSCKCLSICYNTSSDAALKKRVSRSSSRAPILTVYAKNLLRYRWMSQSCLREGGCLKTCSGDLSWFR